VPQPYTNHAYHHHRPPDKFQWLHYCIMPGEKKGNKGREQKWRGKKKRKTWKGRNPNSLVGGLISSGWPKKFGTNFSMLYVYHILTNFWNCFTVRIRRKFTVRIKIHPYLKCVAILPCEMSLSGANGRSVSLIMPLVNGIAGLNASSSSKADTLNIWSKNCRMWQLL